MNSSKYRNKLDKPNLPLIYPLSSLFSQNHFHTVLQGCLAGTCLQNMQQQKR